MKCLTILRHAKSRWNDEELADFDRPLSDRGWKSGTMLGREFNNRGLTFDLVLASPAERVRQTIEAVRHEFRLTEPIRFETEIYLASKEALMELVRSFPETVHQPLLIGHNPGLQELILNLTRPRDPTRLFIARKFPTAAAAVLQLPTKKWKEVRAGTAAVELIVRRPLD